MTQATDGRARSNGASTRLGYLLKHAQLRFAEVSAASLESVGVTGRQAAVLSVIHAEAGISQQEIASRLRVDRTTMVAIVDELESAGLVSRDPHPDDRRKNLVALTPLGARIFAGSETARHSAEKQFLHSLSAADAERFRELLARVAGDRAEG